MQEKIDLLSKIVTYHEEIDRFEAELHEITTSLSVNLPDYTLEKFNQFYNRDFVEHFRFEEQVVFPAIRAWAQTNEYDSILGTYIQTHKKIIIDSKVIINNLMVKENELSKDDLARMVILFAQLNKRNVLHAHHENKHIVPLLEKNTTIRFLSGRNLLSFKSIYNTF